MTAPPTAPHPQQPGQALGWRLGPRACALLSGGLWIAALAPRTRLCSPYPALHRLADPEWLYLAGLLQLLLLAAAFGPGRIVARGRAAWRLRFPAPAARPPLSPAQRRRRRRFRVATALLMTGATLGLAECGLRVSVYRAKLATPRPMVLTTYRWRTPDQEGRRYVFDPTHELLMSTRVRLNNYGYRSEVDVPEPSASQFRIAVLGDSYTECLPSDFSWVDVARPALREDALLRDALGGREVVLANFSLSSSGFVAMYETYQEIRRFRPHLVVVAFIDEDTNRLRPLRLAERSFDVPGVGTFFLTQNLDDGALGQFWRTEDDDPALIFDRERMLRAKQHVLGVYFTRRVLLSSESQLLARAHAATFGAPALEPAREECLRVARSTLGRLQAEVDTLLLHLPCYYEVLDTEDLRGDGPGRPYRYWPRLYDGWRGPPLISLHSYLPLEAPGTERYTWFALPHDGHLSNAGATLYGTLAADLLSRYLRDRGEGAPSAVLVDATEARAQRERGEASGDDP